MPQEHLKTIATYIAEKTGLKIIFKPEAKTASVSSDFTEITLPEFLPKDVIDATVVAIIHESNHIKYSTKPADLGNQVRAKSLFNIVNLLEDIRINEKIYERFPRGKEMIPELHKYIIDELKPPPLKQLPLESQVLSSLIKQGYYQKADISTEAEKMIKDNKFDEIVEQSRTRKNTNEIIPLAIKIYDKLLKGKTDELTKKLDDHFTKSSAEQNKAIADLHREENKAASERTEINAKISEKSNKKREKEEKIKYDEKELKKETKKLNKLVSEKAIEKTEQKIETLDQDVEKEKKETNKLDVEIDKALEKEREKMLEIDSKQQERELAENKEHFDDLKKAIKQSDKKIELENKDGDLDDKIYSRKIKENLLGEIAEKLEQDTTGLIGSGLEELNKVLKEKVDEIDELKLDEVPIRDIFLEYLENKILVRGEVFETGRIEPRRLPVYYTGNVFEEQKPVEPELTRISFYIDISGSMKNRYPFGKKRCVVVSNLLSEIIDIFEEIKPFLKLEYNINTFTMKVREIKPYDVEISTNDEKKPYLEKIQAADGGTEIKAVIDDLNEKQPERTTIKMIALIITDGEFYVRDYDYIREHHPAIDIVWIGIGISESENTQEFFGEFIVNKISELNRAIYQTLLNKV